MSNPGAPDPGFVANRFTAGRSAAANGIDPEVLQLAEGGGGTQTAAPPASPSAGGAAPPSAGLQQPGLPMGLRVQQTLANAPARALSTFSGDIEGSWNQLKQDFVASTGMTPQAQQAFQKGSFWDQMKAQFHQTLATGKTAVDAFNLAVSPLSAAADTAADYEGNILHAALPGVDPQQVRQGINKALLALGPEGGEAGLAEAVGGEAAAVAKGAPAAAEPVAGAQAAAGVKNAAGADTGLSGAGLETPAPAAAEEAPAARPFDIAGEKTGGQIKVTPELQQQAQSYLNGGRADNPIQASLEGLSRDEDLNKTISDVAKFIPEGSVKPDDIRDMNAYSLNIQPDELMARLVPDRPSDEMQAAAGMLINSAAGEFQRFARAAMENPSADSQTLAVRAYAQLNGFIGKFRDAGTDLGRGLRARQAAMDSRDDFTQAVHQIITDVGPENVDEAIRKAAALPDPKTVAPFVSSLRWMGGRDGLLYGWYNFLLSNPATIVKKLTSDAGVMGWNTAVRYAAEKFGKSGDIRPGEAAQLFNGYTGSMRDGIAAAGKALKAGQSQFWGDYQTMDGRVIEASGNHEPGPIAPEMPTQGAIAYLRAALPTSWIGAADDFAKVVNYRAEARALAYRDGMIKKLSGADLSNHVAQTMNNIPAHIHTQAITAALRNTFQEPLTGIAEKLQEIADQINIPVPKTGIDIPLGRIIMPFVKVPANIAKFAYRNSFMARLLPSAAVKAEMAAGGATRDLAIARMGLGTAVSAIVLPFMVGGKITGRGPIDPQINRAWQAAGNKPYSINAGGTWYGYNRVEPIGMHMAALADTVDTVRYAHDEDAEQLAWSMAFGIGDAMLSKTYMQGLSDFLNALHDPQGEGKYYGDKLVASMALPQGGAAIAAATDPWLRQHYDLMGAISARTPGRSTSMPPVRDIWGQPVPHDKGFFPFDSGHTMADLLSPVSMAPADKAQPIDKWIWDNRDAFPDADNGKLGIFRPGQVQSFDRGGVTAQLKLSDTQLDRLRALAGNEMKDPRTGLGARDALNALVTGNFPLPGQQGQWDKASPAARAMMVQTFWNSYRAAGKRQLLSESPDMQSALAEKFNSRVQALRAPSLGDGP